MAVRVKLVDGDTLLVDVEASAWATAFRAALREGAMVQIRNDEGRILAINPDQVAYLEEVELVHREARWFRPLEPVPR